MLEIGALGALTGKCTIWRPRAGESAAGDAPGWIWLIGNPMGRGSGSYSHKPVEPVDSVDQFCQPTPLYLLLFFPWK